MKKYKKPIIVIEEVSIEDIILLSGLSTVDKNLGIGEDVNDIF